MTLRLYFKYHTHWTYFSDSCGRWRTRLSTCYQHVMTWYSVLSFSSMSTYKMPAFFLHMLCYYCHKRKLLGLTFWTTLYKWRQTANISVIVRLCKYTHENNEQSKSANSAKAAAVSPPGEWQYKCQSPSIKESEKKWSIITDLYSAFRSEDTEALDPNPDRRTPKFNHFYSQVTRCPCLPRRLFDVLTSDRIFPLYCTNRWHCFTGVIATVCRRHSYILLVPWMMCLSFVYSWVLSSFSALLVLSQWSSSKP